MENHRDPRIIPPRESPSPPSPVRDANALQPERLALNVVSRRRTVVAGAAFGLLVGGAIGAVTGAAVCWLLGLLTSFWNGVMIGGAVGAAAGTCIAAVERAMRGDLVRPDIATLIGAIYGAVPALLILLGAFGAVKGNFSLFALVGAVFAGPMAGILVGALLDRAFEAGMKRAWLSMSALALGGLAMCGGLLLLFDSLAYGPNTDEVDRAIRASLNLHWRDRLGIEKASIQKLNIRRSGRTTYEGLLEALIEGVPEKLRLAIRFEDPFFHWQLHPADDQ